MTTDPALIVLAILAFAILCVALVCIVALFRAPRSEAVAVVRALPDLVAAFLRRPRR